jgi:hypothetical protein
MEASSSSTKCLIFVRSGYSAETAAQPAGCGGKNGYAMFGVCCLMFVVCCLWFVVCGLLFVVCGLMFVVYCLWFVV